MQYLNIHTHQQLHNGEFTVPSFGLHPWNVTDSWHDDIDKVECQIKTFLANESMCLVGECGLDRLYNATYQQQLDAFKAQVEISERHRLPMIIHCVKAWDDLLRLRRSASLPWVIHGFRGKPTQLWQLLNHDCLISFGFYYNIDSLRECPLERMFLETDVIDRPIAELYQSVAQVKGLTVEALQQQMQLNLHVSLFGKSI